MRTSSLVMMLCFAFMLFSTIGLLMISLSPRHIPPLLFWSMAINYGLFAMAYAYVSIRIHWVLIFAIMPFETLLNWWMQKQVEMQPLLPMVAHSELIARLDKALGLACLMIVISYTLVFVVMAREGKRFFRMHAEVELASEIHRALVPLIDRRVGEFEIYGLSLPSGEVGGDLVDAFVRPEDGSCFAYVADVSGHGVSSGVLMAMLKSAIRMSLRQNHEAGKMLDEVNGVFYSLKAPNSFATLAAISFVEPTSLEIVVAGHLPILHSDGREVRELDTPGLPVGILPDSDFRAITLDLKTSEMLAIVTDGLTEIFNKKGEELSDGYIRAILLKEYSRPLVEIANRVLVEANAWGARSDDQSLLLVRRLG
ncbi:MAG TPA: PP2C family protein-serine/threonine phosphatase [Acidobacteriaceae bacterium]|nr:PP2C family protein-serine/threonine phosphatase [Acidobacteriaceae bacterium]